MNKDERREYKKAWDAENMDKVRHYKKEWYSRNKEAVKERAKYYNDTHKEQRKGYQKKHREFNKELLAKRNKVYRRTLSAKYKFAEKTAKNRHYEFNLTQEEYANIISGGKCHYCNKPLPEVGGGLDRMNEEPFYNKENTVPCCRTCNNTFQALYTYNEKLIIADAIKKIDVMRGKAEVKEDFENLESVEEMLAYLVENNEEDMHLPKPDLSQELNLLSIQTFLRLFSSYKTLNGTERDELEQCAEAYNDADNDVYTRQMALAHVCQIFFPGVKAPEKEIARKNDTKVYQTPCEDCQSSPTHLVVFKTENRSEEHFLCEDCEKAARAEDGDGEQED